MKKGWRAIFCLCVMIGLMGCTVIGLGESAPVENADIVNVEIELENGGVILLELDKAAAPITVESFLALVEKGFYDGVIFHRVVPGFVIQGGAPDGTGAGGPGYEIKGEFQSNGWDNPIPHVRGVVSMARRSGAPDSAGSQFFIVLADAAFLDGEYAAFGRVLEGMEVVDEIAAVKLGAGERPVEPVVMKTVRVVEK